MSRKHNLLSFCLFLAAVLGCVVQADAQIKQTNANIISITGTVRDNMNSILAGVSITNLRSKKTVLTNANGSFSIEAVKGDSLKASIIGYTDVQWTFNDLLNYDIVMTAVAGSLNDVVVTGYGQKQTQVSVVGSVATVNVQELEHPVANLSTMLAGRVAGIVGVQRSGLPGSNAADIWIRGLQSFGGNSTSPLIIIDGVQGRSIDNYDPEDIQSFTILKDAAATALYGSLGANGVILITTKRGSVAKTQIMAQFLEGVTTFTKLPQMADAGEYMNLKNEAEIASGYAPSYSQAYIDSTLSPTANHFVYPNVNWIKQVFNNASSNRKLNVSATGGSESTQYYVSLDYYNESAMIKQDPEMEKIYNAGTGYQRYNFTSNVDMKWTKTTKFALSISGYISEFNEPGNNGGTGGAQNAFSATMNASPVRVPAFYPGDLVAGVAEGSTPSPNPWALVTQTGYDNIYQSQIASTAQITQSFDFWLKGLSANMQYSFDSYNENDNTRYRTRSIWYLNQAQPYNADGSLNLTEVIAGSDNLTFGQSNSGNRQNTFQGMINYDRTFGDDHHVSGMLVYNQLSAMNPYQTSYTAYLPTRQQNYALKAAYSYKNRYFFEFNLGYNGSEDYAPNHRFGWFPAPGVGWVISSEKFFKPLSNIFQYFKIRYTDGLAGAPGTGLRFGYMTLITTSASGMTFGTAGSNYGYSGVNISQYGANVQWAVSHTRDLGLDFHTVNNHLQFVLDYFYSHRTKVFLTRADFPDYAGLQYNPVGNYGIVNASGFEGQITLTPIQLGHKMTLGFNGTFTYNQNKLVDDDEPLYADPYQNAKGQDVNAVQGYIAEGLFQSQAEINNSPDQSALGNPRVGDIKYKDLNGDGVINQYDETTISKGDVPKWTFGAGVNFTYGNFYISAFFQGTEGAWRNLGGVAQSPYEQSDDGNVYAIASDRWTPENPQAHPFYPRLGYGSNANLNNSQPSTWWVKNIGFIRFKTLDVGYNIKNKEWMSHIGLHNLQIYFDGINLCYWSPFKLWDPEMNTQDGDTYPNTRNLSIGIRANF